MTPEIKKIVLPTPELNLNRVGQIVPLVIKMDCAIAVVYPLSSLQIDNTEIVRECVWIFLKPQPKSQDIVKALLEPASGAECFLVFSENGIFALKP